MDEAALKIPFFCEGRQEPALTITFPVKFPNKVAPKVPNDIFENPPFCSFASFLIVLVTPFSKILESSRA